MVKNFHYRESQLENSESSLWAKIENKKQHKILGARTEISATLKNLKDAGIVILSFNSSVPFKNQMDLENGNGLWKNQQNHNSNCSCSPFGIFARKELP